MRRKSKSGTWKHVLPAAVIAAMLAVLPETYAQNPPLGVVDIDNYTGNHWGSFPLDRDNGDPPITVRVTCDGKAKNIEAGENGTCTAESVSIKPVGKIARKVRMNVVSGPYLKKPTGPFKAGKVTFRTGPTNPGCDGRRETEAGIGGRIDDNDLTDLQVLKDGLWYVTIKQRCNH